MEVGGERRIEAVRWVKRGEGLGGGGVRGRKC